MDLRDRLVVEHMGLVDPIADHYASRGGIDRDDLIAEGNLALVEAAERYDPDQYPEFAPYARSYIRGYLKNLFRSARRRASESDVLAPVYRIEAWENQGRAVPLYEQPNPDRLESAVERTEGLHIGSRARACMKALPPEMRKVLELRCGFEDGNEWSFGQISRLMQTSEDRVRMIYGTATRTLYELLAEHAPPGGWAWSSGELAA